MPKIDTRKVKGKQYFRATVDRQSIDNDNRTVDIVFVTERQVMMSTWMMGSYFEILPCNAANGDLTRLNNGGPLCDTHTYDSVRDALGVVEKAWFDNGIGRATVRFSKRADVDSVWQDVQDGIITGVSVGYLVYEYEEIGEKQNLPIYRANTWEAFEISLALVQADPDSGVGRADKDNEVNLKLIQNSKNDNMKRTAADIAEIFRLCREANLEESFAAELIAGEKPIEECRTAITAAKKPATDPAAGQRDTLAERTRVSEITIAAQRAKITDHVFINKLISEGTPLSEARGLIIDKMAAANTSETNPTHSIHVGTDELEKKSRGMEASIMQRAGVITNKDVVGDPGEFRGLRLLDIARMCLEGRGIKTAGMSQMDIAGRALSMMGRDGGAGVSTGDFSYILANVLNKTLRTMWDLQERTFMPFFKKGSLTDFKPALRAQFNDLQVSQVKEGQEYTYATLGDSGESIQAGVYGKIVNINWQAIINDDLDAFSRVPTLLAGAIAQKQSDVAYSVITATQNMYDGNTLFCTAHGNLTTSPGTAISVASLSAARQAMRTQKAPGGNFINIVPKYLVVGPQLETIAYQFTSIVYAPAAQSNKQGSMVATQQANINPWASLIPIIDPRVSGTNWYLMADPMLVDTNEFSLLDGQELFTDTRYGFDIDALQWKVRSAFGAKALEWRSQYQNTGA